jgi:hypothetical protein
VNQLGQSEFANTDFAKREISRRLEMTSCFSTLLMRWVATHHHLQTTAEQTTADHLQLKLSRSSPGRIHLRQELVASLPLRPQE